MEPAAVTPAGSAGAPTEVCVTLISVCAASAPAGMTTFAPLASVTVPPAVPMPAGGGGGGGGVVPPPASSPPPPHPATITHATNPAPTPIHFMHIAPLLGGTTTIRDPSGHGRPRVASFGYGRGDVVNRSHPAGAERRSGSAAVRVRDHLR